MNARTTFYCCDVNTRSLVLMLEAFNIFYASIFFFLYVRASEHVFVWVVRVCVCSRKPPPFPPTPAMRRKCVDAWTDGNGERSVGLHEHWYLFVLQVWDLMNVQPVFGVSRSFEWFLLPFFAPLPFCKYLMGLTKYTPWFNYACFFTRVVPKCVRTPTFTW